VAGALFGLDAAIGLSAVSLFFDGVFAVAFAALIAGATLIVVAASIRPGEAAHAWATSRIVVSALSIPLLLIAFQLIPSSFLANSIWSSAEAALEESLSGFIAIDIVATANSLCRYLVFVAILVSALCIAVNRRRAESLLQFLIVVSTTIASAIAVVLAISGSVAEQGIGLHGPMTAIAGMGVLLSTTSVIRWFEQRPISRGKGAHDSLSKQAHLTMTAVAGALCVAVMAVFASRTAWLALFCAWIPLLAVPVIRSFARRAFLMRVLTAIVVVVAVAVFAVRMLESTGEPAIRIASNGGAAQIGLAQRMLADAPWLGSGAGTYSAMASLYRTVTDLPGALVAPTAAASFTAGLGHPAVAVFTAMALMFSVLFFDRALRRGRDSFYPALGGSCLILMTFNAFLDDGLLGLAVAVLTGSIIGMALGQSLSARASLD
jgi:hypothetical protein